MRMTEQIRSARWVFDCFSWKPTHSDVLKAFSLVQPEEKERIGKFVFIKDAKSSLIGRLLMRKFISDSTGLSWDKINITRDENGKPCFSDNQIHFNVSHSGRYVVLAGEVSRGPVGIDVMEMHYRGGKTIPEFFRLMNRNFDPIEWSFIREPDSELDQLRTFYRYWCLKESYVKATGTGITIDLRSIVFKLNTKPLKLGDCVSDTRLFTSGIEQDQWEFHESLIDEDYCCCVALPRKLSSDIVKNIPLTPLVFNDIVQKSKPIIPVDEEFASMFLNKE